MFWGYLFIVLSATSFSLIPIFAVNAYESGVNTTTLLFLRFAFAACIFFVYSFLKGTNWRITKRQLVSLLLLGGVLYTMQSSMYFTSVRYIPASLAVLLLYLHPIIVAILSFFFNQEKLSRQMLLAFIFSFIGIIFVLGSPSEKVSFIGILFAVGAAVVYSVYILIGDRVTKQIPPMIACAYITLFSAISFFIGGTISSALSFEFSVKGWLMAIGVAFFCSVVAMFTFFAGMNIIGPTKSSVLSMIEPVFTIILSVLFLNEKMSYIQMMGGCIVVIGAIFVVMAREKNKHKIEANLHSKVS